MISAERNMCADAVVFVKPPFGGPEQVFKYLARDTHWVAISNSRLLSEEYGCVTFRWKDYAANNQAKVMKLDAVEFIRRFLLHILPSGFVRIRQFGFLANRARGKKLALCRALLGVAPASPQQGVDIDFALRVDEQDRERCPACGVGRMIHLAIIPATWEPKLLPRRDSA